jgi:hypothetical protein
MLRRLRPIAPALLAPIVALAACSASSNDGAGGGSGGGGGDGPNGAPTGTFDPDDANDAGVASDARAARPQRCDEAGRCSCFNIASLGLPGHTGFDNGSDGTTAFTDYLNEQSSANVDLITTRPTIDADFLAKYDVLIIQWLATSFNGGSGSGYWSFAPGELAALKTWVEAGGGLITLSGYDASAQEVTPLNQLVQAVTGMSYGTADVLAASSSYCLGESESLGGWVQTTPIGQHIEAVGAFHGRPIDPGPRATVDCNDSTYVYAAHEDVGRGHVFAFADEWVTYTSQWFGIDAGPSCADASANVVYQVPQFWFNAITYASQATACAFTLTGPITR